MKTLFVKHSSLRNPRYCVRTLIVEAADGTRSVRKQATYPEGQAHLAEIVAGAKRLAGHAGAFSIAPCVWEGGDVVSPFIAGETLETRLCALLDAADDEAVYALLDRFREALCSMGVASHDPRENPVFRSCLLSESLTLGEMESGGEMDCLPIAPLDLVPSNVIETGEGAWVVIDPEWVFDFPVPLHFVLYRAIAGLERARHTDRGLSQAQMLYHFGILPEEALRYEAWEQAFSARIVEPDGLLAVKARYEYPVARLDASAPSGDGYAPIAFSRVYFDRGAGFREEDSVRIATRSGGIFHWAWDLGEGAPFRALRFDPSEGRFVYLSVNRAAWRDDAGEWHDFAGCEHNGWPWEEGLVFASLDPWVTYTAPPDRTVCSVALEGAWRYLAPKEFEESLLLSRVAHWQIAHGNGAAAGPAFRDLLAWQKAFWQERLSEAESQAQKNHALAGAESEARKRVEAVLCTREEAWAQAERERAREREALDREREALSGRLASAESSLASQLQAIEEARQRESELRLALAQREGANAALRHQLDELQARFSWRVMEQPRKIYATLRRHIHSDDPQH